MVRVSVFIFVWVVVMGLGRAAEGSLSGGPGAPDIDYMLEGMVAEADFVMVGRFESAKEGETRGGEWTRWDVRLEEVEVLKVPAERAAPRLFPFWSRQEVHWPRRGERVLAFVTEVGGLDVINLEGGELTWRGKPLWDLEFRELKDRGEMMAIVRAEVARVGRTGTAWVWLDAPLGRLHVVEDERLLPAMRRWVQSDSPRARAAAAELFTWHFEARDTAALRGLLADPYVVDDAWAVSPWNGRLYMVRDKAAHSLMSMKMDYVGSDLMEPRAGLYRGFWRWALLWALLPVVLVGIWEGVRRYWKRPRQGLVGRMASWVTLFCFYGAVMAGVLWNRSRQTVDEIVFARSGWLIDAVFAKGAVFLETSSEWPGESSLVHLAIARGEEKGVDSLRHELGRKFGTSVFRDWAWGESHDVTFAFFREADLNAHPWGWRSGTADRVRGRTAGLSLIYVMALCAVFPMLHGIWFGGVWWRNWRRGRRGLCVGCGYDLRASVGRCPECGREVNGG
jgi:hypothetical protein